MCIRDRDYLGPDGCAPREPGQGGLGSVVERCTAAYSPGVTLAYFLVLGALAGIAVAATVVVAVDRFLAKR